MVREFLVFYAPFIVLIISIAASFWVAAKDDVL